MRVKSRGLVALAMLSVPLGLVLTSPGFKVWHHPWLQGMRRHMQGTWSTEDRLQQFGAMADARWRPRFAAAGVTYTPHEVALLVFKDRKCMEVHARNPDGRWAGVLALPILAASGGPGPKLREGDMQVPEGFYAICSLNPNSRFHVALRLDYPNRSDVERARSDGRGQLGGDIMIHGAAASVGCLAMGDEAAEDLYTLAARCGLERVRVMMAPSDPRRGLLMPRPGDPPWVAALYGELSREMVAFPPMNR